MEKVGMTQFQILREYFDFSEILKLFQIWKDLELTKLYVLSGVVLGFFKFSCILNSQAGSIDKDEKIS